MNLVRPLVGLLTVLVVLACIIPTKEPTEPMNAASFVIYTVRPDGLCLYVKKNKDGSLFTFEDKTRSFTEEELLQMRQPWDVSE